MTEIKSSILEHCAKYFDVLDSDFPMTPPQIAASIRRMKGKDESKAIQTIDVHEELRRGGDWLGAARRWMQNNINRGDTLTWGSNECVSIPFCKLEEFARVVAVEAVTSERRRIEQELSPREFLTRK